MNFIENLLLYGTLGIYALVVGAIVLGATVMIVMAIEVADDVKKNGW